MFTAVNGVDFEQWNWYAVKWISAARIQKLATSLPVSSTFMASFSASAISNYSSYLCRDAQHQSYLCATQWLSLMHLVTMTFAAPITDLVNIQSIQQVSWRKFFSVMTLMLVALLIGSRHYYTWIDYRGFKDICRLFSQYSKKNLGQHCPQSVWWPNILALLKIHTQFNDDDSIILSINTLQTCTWKGQKNVMIKSWLHGSSWDHKLSWGTEKPNAIYKKSSSNKFKTSFFRASDARDLISIHIYGIVEKTPQNVTWQWVR